MEFYISGLFASIAGIIIIIHAIKKRKELSRFLFSAYFVFSLTMICFGGISIILKKYDTICAILFGMVMLIDTYKDKSFTPGMYSGYIGHLNGYIGGLMFIIYGVGKLLLDGE